MKLSAKTKYGIQALFEIALLGHLGGISSSDIAGSQGIPPRFLEQILLTLKKAKLIKSLRGRSSGDTLARPAEEIDLLEVIDALEGPLSFSSNLKKGSLIAVTINNIEKQLKESLKSITFKALVEAKRKKDRSYTYSI